MTDRPLLAVTLGDPAGIGPELVVASLAHSGIRERCRPLAVGDAGALRRAAETLADARPVIRRVEHPADARFDPGTIEVWQPGPDRPPVGMGEVSAQAGSAAVEAVRAAAKLGADGTVDGIVTAPLNKAAMHAAGEHYPGHTELLAELFGAGQVSLVLAADGLAVCHVTTHVALRAVPDLVTTARVRRTISLAHAFTRAMETGEPGRIAVIGLNPHAGEGGLFGDEDDLAVAPAVAAAQRAGVPVEGPLPADAALPAAVRGDYRAVVVMYHDQGHAFFKSVYGDRGVNVTVGLPVVRTSVDHGTAFDIAGTGVARPDSMLAALRLAAQLAPGWGEVWRALQ